MTLTDKASLADVHADRAVHRWLGILVKHAREGRPASGSGVTVELVELGRGRFRRFYLRRAQRGLPPVACVDDAIGEARARCAIWTPSDYLFFCWWIRCGFDWPVRHPGWGAELLDAVADDLPSETLGPATFIAWQMGNPQGHLLTGRWRELFNRGGYVEDQAVVERPSGSLILYRGATWEDRANWSWTSKFAVADLYRHHHGGQNALVWVALVRWENVLARTRKLALPDPLNDEFVVDTMRRDKPGWTIPIRPLDLPVRRSHWPQCRTGRMAVTFTAQRCQECGALVDGRSAVMFESVSDAFFGRRSPSWRK